MYLDIEELFINIIFCLLSLCLHSSLFETSFRFSLCNVFFPCYFITRISGLFSQISLICFDTSDGQCTHAKLMIEQINESLNFLFQNDDIPQTRRDRWWSLEVPSFPICLISFWKRVNKLEIHMTNWIVQRGTNIQNMRILILKQVKYSQALIVLLENNFSLFGKNIY